MRPLILITLTSVAVVALAGPASAQNDKARAFLHKALEGDNSETMLGKLAAEHASSAEAKSYGRMLAEDHSMHREKVIKAGGPLHLPDESQPAAEATKERDKLSHLSGRDFDRELGKYMVKDHKKDMAEYKKATKLRGEPGQLARETLPTLEKHLDMARRLAG